ncbi:hypothetical protein ACS0TY_015231 [Phlomoides rotata]
MASLLIPPLKFTIRSVFFIVILWIALVCIAEINAGGDIGVVLGKGGSEQREFDYFKLALQWPATYCRRTRHCCSSNGCCRGSNGPKGFTIHGLWADYNDGTWPSCCTGKKFDVKEVSTLLDSLNKYWPSLSCEKHGTCSSAVTGDEYNFFVTALNIYFKYNVTEVLAEAGYVASSSEKYPLGGIISAIENAFHTTPVLECSGDAVEELYLCFYKNFEPRDCALDSMVNSKKSCPNYVSLPEYASLKLGDSKTELLMPTLHSSI